MTAQRPIKVLQVIHGLSMGGAETWLIQLLRYWAAAGTVQLDFLLTGGEAQIFDQEAKDLGASLHYIRYGRRDLLSFWNHYHAVLTYGSYDAIHDHADYASGWHFALGLGHLPPIRIAHVHNPWLHISDNYAVNPLRKFTAATGKRLVETLATHICGTSVEILKQYDWPPGKYNHLIISPTYCGFDVTTFSQPRDPDRISVLREFGWPPESKLVLFVGRLDRALEFNHPQNHKNSWFTLHAAHLALHQNPQVRLLMVGDGIRRKDIEEQIAHWRESDQLRLTGIRNDVPRLMRAADMLLFPSRQEGLGMVAVEAQAAGLPVLASTAVPSEAKVIPDLYYSLSLEEPLSVWADTLLNIMAKPKLPIELCREALKKSDFSIASSAHKLEKIYRSAQP